MNEKIRVKIWIREEPGEPWGEFEGFCNPANWPTRAAMVAGLTGPHIRPLIAYGVADCVVEVYDDVDGPEFYLVRTRQTAQALSSRHIAPALAEVEAINEDDKSALVAVENEIKRLSQIVNSSWHDERALNAAIRGMQIAKLRLGEIVAGNGGAA